MTGEPLTEDDLVEIKANAAVKVRPVGGTGVPGMLTMSVHALSPLASRRPSALPQDLKHGGQTSLGITARHRSLSPSGRWRSHSPRIRGAETRRVAASITHARREDQHPGRPQHPAVWPAPCCCGV